MDALDANETGGVPYLVMPHVDGRALDGLIAARGRLEQDHVIKIGMELALALGAVHRAGIAHRDVKPSNVLVTSSSLCQTRLCDFGGAFRPPTHPQM